MQCGKQSARGARSQEGKDNAARKRDRPPGISRIDQRPTRTHSSRARWVPPDARRVVAPSTALLGDASYGGKAKR